MKRSEDRMPHALVTGRATAHAGIIGCGNKNVLGRDYPRPSTVVYAKAGYRLEDSRPASTNVGTFKSATTTTAKKMRFPVFFIWIHSSDTQRYWATITAMPKQLRCLIGPPNPLRNV